MQKRGLLKLVGFLLFLFGTLSLVFVLIGARFVFLSWIDDLGSVPGLLIKLAMIFGGIIIMYIASLPPETGDE